MNELNYSASAFPSVYHPHGLTKRELFAAMAMQGMAGIDTIGRGEAAGSEKHGEWVQALAQDAVLIADALLAELAKEPT